MKGKFFSALAGLALVVGQIRAQSYEDGFQQRKALLINQLCTVNFQVANLPDPEKHNWPRVIARLSKYGNDDTTANRFIRQFRNNSPFHFTLVGMARIMGQYPQADTLVKYRGLYLANVFARTDSYNAFTGEGTENHINMSRTSGYLYAQYALAQGANPTAARHMAEARSWIMYYAKKIYHTGTGEWNSSVYEAYNVVGWLNLFDLAQDTAVRAAAHAVLDYYAAEIALHHFEGVTGGAEMRGVALTSSASSDDYLAWVWFGGSPKDATQSTFWTGKEYSQAVHAAVSRYRPPSIAVALALKQENIYPAYYANSKPGYYLTQPGYIQQNLYQDADYSLGTAYIPYGGFTNGDFQIVNWKLVGKTATANTSAQVITGNGKYYNNWSGKWRNPYDQFVQHKNVLVQLSLVPTDTGRIHSAIKSLVEAWATNWQRDFSVRFPPPNDASKGNPVAATATVSSANPNSVYISYPPVASQLRKGGITFLSFERCYVAIRSLYLDSATAEAAEGNSSTRKQVQDQAPLGQLCGTVAEVGSKAEYATLSAFANAILANTKLYKAGLQANHRIAYKTLGGDSLSIHYNTSGNFTEAVFDWGYGVTTQQPIIQAAPWQQPAWPSGEGYGRLADWSINGQPFVPTTSVFEGPNMSLSNNRLIFSENLGHFQTVDYSDTIPVFQDFVSAVASQLPDAKRPTVAPNPNRGIFTITVPEGASTLQSGQIYTAGGKLVKKFTLQQVANGAQVDLRSVSTGAYIIRFSWLGKPYSERIVIE